MKGRSMAGFGRRVAARLAPTVFACVCLILGTTMASAQIVDVTVHSAQPGTITTATGSQLQQFPSAFGFDAIDGSGNMYKKVFLSYSESPDSASATPVATYRVSTNGGLTFPASSEVTGSPMGFLNAVKRMDGTLLAFDFKPTGVVAGTSNKTWKFQYYTSTDEGANWTTHTNGTVTFPQSFDTTIGPRMHGGILTDPDGTLYALAYGNYVGDTKNRSMLAKSTNGGAAWTIVSTIGASGTLNFNETAIARTVNGSLLAVMRVASNQPMYYARSTDNGSTWTTPAKLPGVSDTNAQSVDPVLQLLPNGVLVLSYGRPNTKILLSEDGNGTSWTNLTSTFSETPNVLETTGYTALVTVGPNRFLQIGDTGADWSYSPIPSPNPFSIWGKTIDVVKTPINRIDLKEKYKQGKITVTTDMTYTNAAHPEARIAGAFDGSTNYWSGAFKAGSAGSTTNATFQIALDKMYRLSDIGTSLQIGTAESAQIYLSQDGVNWGIPVKTFTNKKHYAIEYTHFNVPISAQYVKVEASGTTGYISLNELELYSTEDTFENNALADVPYGYTDASMATVSDADGFESDRALYINDTSSSSIAVIKKITEATDSKQLTFRLKPTAYGTNGAIMFDILANVTSGNPTAYHFASFSNGSLKYYNGSAWVQIGGAGTVPFNTWSQIRVDATLTSANVYVNGTLIGSAGMYANPANVINFNGYAFASSGTTPVGDKAYIDDVLMTEGSTINDTFESGTVGAAPAGYSGATMATISNTQAYGGTRSLRIFDNSTSAIAMAPRIADPADGKTLQFYAYIQAAPTAFLFDINGTVTTGTTTVIHLGIFNDGSVKYHNGSSWVAIGGAGTITTLNAWNKIRVEATKSVASVYINNAYIGAAAPYANPANVVKLNGFKFASGGTAPTGDDIYVDNVYFGH